MEVIERQLVEQNWITFLFLFCCVLLALLKLFSPTYLSEYFKAFFLQGFIQKRIEESTSLFSVSDVILYVFSVMVLSLTFGIIVFRDKLNLVIYTAIFFFVLFYGLLRNLIDKFIEILIIQTKYSIYFRFTKVAYLETTALWLLPVLVVYQYGLRDIYLIYCFLAVLLFIRALLIVLNNKNFIWKNLFYFILYLCTLEIAPLLILYKLAMH